MGLEPSGFNMLCNHQLFPFLRTPLTSRRAGPIQRRAHGSKRCGIAAGTLRIRSLKQQIMLLSSPIVLYPSSALRTSIGLRPPPPDPGGLYRLSSVRAERRLFSAITPCCPFPIGSLVPVLGGLVHPIMHATPPSLPSREACSLPCSSCDGEHASTCTPFAIVVTRKAQPRLLCLCQPYALCTTLHATCGMRPAARQTYMTGCFDPRHPSHAAHDDFR